VCAGIEERPQTFSRERDRIRPRDADRVETLRAGDGGERGLKRRRI